MTDKVNISSIVSSQFPDFIKEDYETFVAFVKAYYEFLQQEYDTDLRTIRDIDTTLDEYIKHFKSEYVSNIPFILADEKFVIQHIKDLNLAKGSEASYRLLFRLLYNKEIEIGYPSKQMLRASDGRWEQKVSIFVGVVSGNIDKIVNNTVEIIHSTYVIKTQVYSYKNLNIEIDGRAIYELSINRRYFGEILINDQVVFGGIFVARVVPTIAKFKIVQSGKNFKVGELYDIGTTGTVLKIVETGLNGSILYAQIIKFSMDTKFEGDFLYSLTSKRDGINQSTTLNYTLEVVLNLKNVGLMDNTRGFTESGSISRTNYNIDVVPPALDGSYVGETVRTFSDASIVSIDQVDISAYAYIQFIIGGVSKYPGYFSSNAGFLSDAMFIQDSKFYQLYSYVIKIDEKLSAYESAVKTLVHPAGVALFGEYTIINSFDISVDLQALIKSLIVILKTTVNIVDAKSLDISKTLSDSFTSIDNNNIYITKILDSDSFTSVDSGAIWRDPYLEDMGFFLNDTVDYMENKIGVF